MNPLLAPNYLGRDLYALGPSYAPIYLYQYQKQRWLLIDGGLKKDAHLILEQLKSIVCELEHITMWFITHAHFDHYGCVESISALLPSVKLYAAEKTCQLLTNKKYRALMSRLNDQAICRKDDQLEISSSLLSNDELSINPIATDKELLLDNLAIKAISIPGHSEDMVAFFFPDTGAVFVGDALGDFLMHMTCRPLIFHDCADYLHSLIKLNELSAKYIYLGHHLCIDCDKQAHFISDVIFQTKQFIEAVKAEISGGATPKELAENYSKLVYPSVREMMDYSTLEKSFQVMFKHILHFDIKTMPLPSSKL